MKIKRSLYTTLQYFSTIDDTFAYLGNGYMIMKDKAGSGFVEAKAPDYFFKDQLIIRSLSKFLKLFSFDKKDKSPDPESIQDWTIGTTIDMSGEFTRPDMYITSPGHRLKLKQGLQQFADNRKNDLVSKFDGINLEESLKFQLTHTLYKQIISDCSLLDLDTITIMSENDDTIKIYLTKQGKGTNDDYSSFDVECRHQHCPTKIKFQLSAFSLIDATDHQLEFGKFKHKFGTSNVLKIRSFCDNNIVVNRVILGTSGD